MVWFLFSFHGLETKHPTKFVQSNIQEKHGGYDWWKKSCTSQLIGGLSHSLQGFIYPRWCRIASINSSCWVVWAISLRCLVLFRQNIPDPNHNHKSWDMRDTRRIPMELESWSMFCPASSCCLVVWLLRRCKEWISHWKWNSPKQWKALAVRAEYIGDHTTIIAIIGSIMVHPHPPLHSVVEGLQLRIFQLFTLIHLDIAPISFYIHSSKLRWQWKNPIFNRSIFHRHISFRV